MAICVITVVCWEVVHVQAAVRYGTVFISRFVAVLHKAEVQLQTTQADPGEIMMLCTTAVQNMINCKNFTYR
jgi:hypothetical protein